MTLAADMAKRTEMRRRLEEHGVPEAEVHRRVMSLAHRQNARPRQHAWCTVCRVGQADMTVEEGAAFMRAHTACKAAT